MLVGQKLDRWERQAAWIVQSRGSVRTASRALGAWEPGGIRTVQQGFCPVSGSGRSTCRICKEGPLRGLRRRLVYG